MYERHRERFVVFEVLQKLLPYSCHKRHDIWRFTKTGNVLGVVEKFTRVWGKEKYLKEFWNVLNWNKVEERWVFYIWSFYVEQLAKTFAILQFSELTYCYNKQSVKQLKKHGHEAYGSS
ncbi:hypothetical protein M405DRAFT_845996 [Rhizopogon salebrosus TDB-379]|nr:hypothetical protein M405DRAFT_845996 [Rhizopogon salebrosus TDB-379]